MVTNDVIFTGCSHALADPSQAPMGETEKNYLHKEGACPICKKPFNALLPVVCKQTLDTLLQTDDQTPTPSDLLASFLSLIRGKPQ